MLMQCCWLMPCTRPFRTRSCAPRWCPTASSYLWRERTTTSAGRRRGGPWRGMSSTLCSANLEAMPYCQAAFSFFSFSSTSTCIPVNRHICIAHAAPRAHRALQTDMRHETSQRRRWGWQVAQGWSTWSRSAHAGLPTSNSFSALTLGRLKEVQGARQAAAAWQRPSWSGKRCAAHAPTWI